MTEPLTSFDVSDELAPEPNVKVSVLRALPKFRLIGMFEEYIKAADLAALCDQADALRQGHRDRQ
jgi:hypothetical protein